MGLSNIFKKKTTTNNTKDNQKIIDNIMEFIDEQKEKNLILLEKGGQPAKTAKDKLDFIREIYKNMNS